MPEYIVLNPKWKAAAAIYIAALENGTADGKAAAKEGIMEMAEYLDEYNENGYIKAKAKEKEDV